MTKEMLAQKANTFIEAYNDLLKSVAKFWNDIPKDENPDSDWMRCGSIVQDLGILSHIVRNPLIKIERLLQEDGDICAKKEHGELGICEES